MDKSRSTLQTCLRGWQRGMTLVEIMVVLAILGILGTAVTYGFVRYFAKAKIKATKTQLQTITKAIDTNYATENEYPESLKVLADGQGAPLKENQLKDPWGEEIIYRLPGEKNTDSYDIFSKGPDKREGNEDDIWPD